MIKPMLILWVLCGQPYFIQIHDDYGYAQGYYHSRPPVSIQSRIVELYKNPDTIFSKQDARYMFGVLPVPGDKSYGGKTCT